MDIQLAQYLFHLGIKIPGTQFVHLHDGVADPVMVFGFASRFKFLDGVDHGVVMKEDIIRNGFLFYKYRILFKQHHIHILIDPDFTTIRGFLSG